LSSKITERETTNVVSQRLRLGVDGVANAAKD